MKKREKNCVIFKWNPAISSYTFKNFLEDIAWKNNDSDWSVWDHKKVRRGDLFFMLKVGCGTNGIVAAGKITGKPVIGEDWSGAGRKVYYSTYLADLMINPETLPVISSDILKAAISDFNWYGGHSGEILNQSQSEILKEIYAEYLKENIHEFNGRLQMIKHRNSLNDQIFIRKKLKKKLLEASVEADE